MAVCCSVLQFVAVPHTKIQILTDRYTIHLEYDISVANFLAFESSPIHMLSSNHDAILIFACLQFYQRLA